MHGMVSNERGWNNWMCRQHKFDIVSALQSMATSESYIMLPVRLFSESFVSGEFRLIYISQPAILWKKITGYQGINWMVFAAARLMQIGCCFILIARASPLSKYYIACNTQLDTLRFWKAFWECSFSFCQQHIFFPYINQCDDWGEECVIICDLLNVK